MCNYNSVAARKENKEQSLFRACEKELRCLDMRINATKIMLSAHWPKI